MKETGDGVWWAAEWAGMKRKEVVAFAEGIAERAVVSFPFLSLETGSRFVAQSGLKPATCPLVSASEC